jgi:hypothetical protein
LENFPKSPGVFAVRRIEAAACPSSAFNVGGRFDNKVDIAAGSRIAEKLY